jgi:uncharacterized protein YbbK (DUF523 family)
MQFKRYGGKERCLSADLFRYNGNNVGQVHPYSKLSRHQGHRNWMCLLRDG